MKLLLLQTILVEKSSINQFIFTNEENIYCSITEDTNGYIINIYKKFRN